MTNKSKVERLVRLARAQVGRPYYYGVKVTAQPRMFDCSSLVQWLYQKGGIKLPRRSLEQAAQGRSVRRRIELLQPGDLLFFTGEYGHYDPKYPQGIGHVAVYVGDKKAIHAKGVNGNGKVKVVPIIKLWRRPDLVAIRRIFSS
ncbi:MAG: glycoside hydrolase [Parcubacteria group bacterium GW2011_GWD2_43_10]|uniref:NlpC/P60 domain-containing protein n=1 Tax=Candidatus Veblenbacteria bacterium RIFOXYD1_FULL_43_11 TaxID=1802429 RepID=A0A1G2Q6E5_9BACT|nr:MAG: glycoside hydrolase [Parcubacteria group bacterium GW2011_GWD2_43_10]KKS92171.1 MAG: glycoside hydrolase [Parcubacteria group bacterium GW2011_GWE2_43_12]OHA56110.1 MAG: hypothetical protein A2588_01030 [Candidatus Veblenbacteria bacterium RIFOXYD1_FULL_43_11]HAO81411.1 hypothetical protein [Candidatus Veblenbacteria bacterium]